MTNTSAPASIDEELLSSNAPNNEELSGLRSTGKSGFLKRLSVNYDDLLKNAQTGDIVLMQGTHLSSWLVQLIEASDWSHSAMIVLGRDIPDLLKPEYEDAVLLWESNVMSDTLPNVVDVIDNKPKEGPMLVKLTDRIRINFDPDHQEDKALAIRHLHFERTPEMFKSLIATISEVHTCSFPSEGRAEFENFLLGRIDNKPPKIAGTFFCSQLLAYTLQNMGLLSTVHVPNAFAPADFAEKVDVALLQRAWLGKEIRVETKGVETKALIDG